MNKIVIKENVLIIVFLWDIMTLLLPVLGQWQLLLCNIWLLFLSVCDNEKLSEG